MNTVGSGILRFAESPNIRNNIVVGSGVADFNINSGTWGASSSNNLSSDTTAPGSNSLTSQTLSTVDFVSTTSGIEDFHLLPTSVAKDAGTSLSSTFTTDIDNQTRPYGSAWDIGADESSVSSSSGTFTSRIYDTNVFPQFGTMSWSAATPARRSGTGGSCRTCWTRATSTTPAPTRRWASTARC
mgnify:CR=1 FL=1